MNIRPKQVLARGLTLVLVVAVWVGFSLGIKSLSSLGVMGPMIYGIVLGLFSDKLIRRWGF